jgi:NAD-dependent deacetylase
MTTRCADERLVELLRGARRILVFTGAGISTNSGIPDYRGPQGVWNTKRPVYFQDFVASEEARVLYWKQKSEGWETMRDARPNATHEAVAALERAGKIEAVVTQNIDGLHEKAGTSRARLVEIHGTALAVGCLECDARSPADPFVARFRETGVPPHCEACGGLLKPATISFGQALREDDMRAAAAAGHRCDLAVAMGSTLSVYPAAEVPLVAARRRTPYVVINRGPTEHDGLSLVALRLEGDCAEIFPPAVEAALG